MCDGKRGYDSMAEADEVAERMQAAFPQYLYSVYPCLFCRFVHVGRRNPAEREKNFSSLGRFQPSSTHVKQ